MILPGLPRTAPADARCTARCLLVVSAQAARAATLAQALAHRGCAVSTCSTFNAALLQVCLSRPRTVLADLDDLDGPADDGEGLAFAHALRADPHLAGHLPRPLVLVALLSPRLHALGRGCAARAAGYDHALTLPLDVHALYALLARGCDAGTECPSRTGGATVRAQGDRA